MTNYLASYTPRCGVSSPASRNTVVGMTNDVGTYLLALASMWLQPPTAEVEFWSNAGPANDLYTEFQKNASADFYDDELSLWKITLKSQQTATFCGPFDDAVSVCRRFGVHVNFSENIYPTLRAMDAGCICVTAAPMDEDFICTRLSPGTLPATISEALENYDSIFRLVETLNESIDFARYADLRDYRSVVEHNRMNLRSVHDPDLVVSELRCTFDN